MLTIKFVYTDGQDVDVNIEKEKVEELFKQLKEKEIYWTKDDKENGFWLNMENIRYIQFVGHDSKVSPMVEAQVQTDENNEEANSDGVEVREA